MDRTTKFLEVRVGGAVLSLLMAAAAAAAFYRLGAKSLWFDEITGGRVAELKTLREILAARKMDSHPPAMAFAEHWAKNYFGLSEWSLRFPAAVAAVATIPFVVAVAAALGDRRAGWLAAALVVASPTFIFYAQDARPYALALFFTTAASAFFLFAFAGRRQYVWLPLYAAFTALAFYTHYFTTLVAATHFAVAAAAWVPALRPAGLKPAKKFGLTFGGFVLALAAAAVAALPVFGKAIYDRERFPGGEMELTPSLVAGAFASVGWDRPAATALSAIAVIAGTVYLRRRFGNFAAWAAAALASVPLFLPVVVIRLTTEYWHPRFSLFAMPAFLVLTSFGVVALLRDLGGAVGRNLGTCFLAAVLAGGGMKAVVDNGRALRYYYATEKQDFRTAVALINRNSAWVTGTFVWPFRNWDAFYFYTKTLGGPAAEAKPREKLLRAFKERAEVFLMSTDAEFSDEVQREVPLAIRLRFKSVDVLYYNQNWRTAGDVYGWAGPALTGAPPGTVAGALGRFALARGDKAKAWEYLKKAAVSQRRDNPDLFHYADLCAERGDVKTARTLIGRYVRAHPDEPWPYTKLALTYLQTGDVNTAVYYYRRALWLAPEKENWRRTMEEIIGRRRFFHILIGYTDPRWL